MCGCMRNYIEGENDCSIEVKAAKVKAFLTLCRLLFPCLCGLLLFYFLFQEHNNIKSQHG